MTLAQEARAYAALRAKELEAKHKWEEIKEKRELREQALKDRMDREQVESIKSGGKLVTRNEPTPYAQVNDRAAFIEWARENDEGLLEIKERTTDGILNQLVRQRLEDKQELPPGLTFYTKGEISLRAA